MKKLEFETSKGNFILFDVDSVPSVEQTHPLWIPDFYKASNIEFNLFGEKVKTICRLSDITEEQAGDVVCDHKVSSTTYYHNYSKYEALDFRDIIDNSFDTAIESLQSLIKSKGVHLFENPYENSTDLNSIFFSMQEDFNKEKEAEEKTFYNPCLFKVI